MSKMKITYFGNKTSAFSGAKTTIESLSPLFQEFLEVSTSSSAKNILIRIAAMVICFFRKGIQSDWILIDVYSTKAYWYAEIISRLARSFNKRYIVILHGGNLPDRHKRNPQSIKRVFDYASHIVAPSPYLKSYFEQNGYKVTLIPNLIELNHYPFFQRKSLRPLALGIRGFKSPYNALMTLDAIRICRDKGTEVQLLLLGNKGEDDYQKIIEFIALHKLDPLVTISKKIPKEEWIALSVNYDIMISNPLIDNSPVSIVEGMALGMCVVTTNVGGIPDFVENNKEVLYVSSNNSEELANKIMFLLKDSELAEKLSKMGRLKAEQFDWINVKVLWKNLLGV